MTVWMAARISRIVIAVSLFAVGCMAEEDTRSELEQDASDGQMTDLAATTGAAAGGPFSVVNLIADTPGLASHTDPALRNAWGVVPFDRRFWVADNATGVLSIVDGQGVSSTGASAGAPASGAIALEGGITGIAATGVSPHDTTRFQIHAAGRCGPALLIVASETGKLFGVNPDLSATGGSVVVDRSDTGAIYKGVAVLQRRHDRRGPLILAADFHNARIDVFDASFTLVTQVSFVAHGLPQGFAPYNVMAIDDTVYVTYAKQDADAEDDVAGPGLGYVAAFRTSGELRRLVNGLELDAPWGMVLARRFDSLPPSLLVGNFGDGHITVLEPTTLRIRGQLRGTDGAPIAIDGLWGLAFGDGVRQARSDALYFAAGPEDESHGLFGRIVPRRH